MMRAVCRFNDDCLPREFDELIGAVDSLPDALSTRVLPLCRAITEWSRGQQRLVQAAQEAVNQLQLDIKCLRFDLDMTRRERDAIRQDGRL
jgi:hypothetical protein